MTPGEALNNYLKGLDKSTRDIKLRDICDACSVSVDVVWNWRQGRTRIKGIYRREINTALGFDMFEGTEESPE